MTTIRVRKGRLGTTIHMKAEKGEGLREIVELLAGRRPRAEKWISHAQWPLDVYRGMDGKGISTDEHDTRQAAQHICDALRREGFSCEGKHFPIRTWVTKAGETQ